MKNYVVKKNYGDIFDVFGDFFEDSRAEEMRADVVENEDSYRLDVATPGFNKEQVKVELDDGYLTISCEKREEKDEKYLRREIAEETKRSFYVGREIRPEMIKAKYENGVLSLTVPKNAPKEETKKLIAID